ncbi:MAG: translation initiation factor IF-2 subunit gamma [Nitrospiraceae bacterium]|nr:translation initiation factor IF-2 subunit gamma [Nitrospiraceae bacterium]
MARASSTTKKKKKESDKFIPCMNIGLVGHVDHGKTTLVKALTGVWTDTHSEELKRGITIKLGYANATIYYCKKCNIYTTHEKCPICGGKTTPVRTVSFVDAPGHESLMATMLSGSAIIDLALLLVAANEPCPQPQTREHLMALKITNIKDIVVVQNKIDLVTKEQALKNYLEIKNFLKSEGFEDVPIIPISAQQGVNIDKLLSFIVNFPIPKSNTKVDPLMFVARSFDINKPGSDPTKLKGGILGGAVKKGVFRIGDEIEIKPGIKIEKKGKTEWLPLTTKIIDLHTGNYALEEAAKGGSVALMTTLDPSITRSDSLAGCVVGLKGKLPPVWHQLFLEVHLLERVVGAREELKVESIKNHELLMLNVNSAATVGIVSDISKKRTVCNLKIPVCAEVGSRVTISRRIASRWRLIGYGIIKEK